LGPSGDRPQARQVGQPRLGTVPAVVGWIGADRFPMPLTGQLAPVATLRWAHGAGYNSGNCECPYRITNWGGAPSPLRGSGPERARVGPNWPGTRGRIGANSRLRDRRRSPDLGFRDWLVCLPVPARVRFRPGRQFAEATRLSSPSDSVIDQLPAGGGMTVAISSSGCGPVDSWVSPSGTTRAVVMTAWDCVVLVRSLRAPRCGSSRVMAQRGRRPAVRLGVNSAI
jgi:hypothetical protein